MSVSSEEFRAALAKGSGRAMLLLRQSPDGQALQDELLAACTHNLAYDPQCENERSRYLADLVSATGEHQAFFARLLALLDGKSDADEQPDIPQIFAILALLALDHPDLDAEAVRQAYAQLDDEEDRLDCLDSLVRLDGLPAFLDAAEKLNADLEDRWWRIDGLIEILRAREDADLDAELSDLRTENSALDRLLTHAETQQSSAPEEPATYDFDAIRTSLRGGVRPDKPWRWLSRLNDAEWRALAEDLTAEADEKRATVYLRLFARRDFPDDPHLLFRWAEGPSELASNFFAVSALGRIRAPEVRALALKAIRAGQPRGARLLRSNFEPGDFAELERLLDTLSDLEATHDLGLSILDILSKEKASSEARDILLRLYERTPCSTCRNSAVAALVDLDAVPPWMAEECGFDAEPETVRLFAASDQTSPATRP